MKNDFWIKIGHRSSGAEWVALARRPQPMQPLLSLTQGLSP